MFTLINLLTALVMLISVILAFKVGKRAGINEVIVNGVIFEAFAEMDDEDDQD